MSLSKLLRAAIVGLAIVFCTTGASAERLNVRTEVTPDSIVVTFPWRDPVAYDHTLKDGVFTIRFSRPIEGSFQRIVSRSGGIVETVTSGSDGRSVILALTRPVQSYVYYTGTAVTVELVETGEQNKTQPASVPTPTETSAGQTTLATDEITASRSIAEAQATPTSPPKIGVRTGEHADYTRVVFDFTENTPYTINNDEGVVKLTFEAAADLDLSRLNREGVPFLGGARSQISGGQTIVTMAVPPTAPLRDFLSGSKVVIDIRQPTGDPAPVALPQDAPVPVVADQNPEPAAPAPPPPVGDATPSNVAPQVTDQAPPPPAQPVAPVETVDAAAAQDGAVPASPGRPVSLRPPSETAAVPSSAGQEALSGRAAPRSLDEPLTAARVKAFPDADALAFRFDFAEPVAAATFRRGGAVWIVFDKPQTVDTDALKAEAGEAAFEILQLPNPDATVLRIRTSQRYNPAVKRDGLAWVIDLADRELAPQSALKVTAQPTSQVGPRLFISVPEPGRPIPIIDPNVGDNFIAVPVIPLGQAVGRNYTYPQFQLRVAAQGVVIDPLTDDLRVRSLRQGVEISNSGVELAVSNVSADAAAHAELNASRPMVRALGDLGQYYAPPSEFLRAKREMETAVSAAPENRRTPARLELAKFFFANAYAAETLGILRVAIADIPLLEDDPVVRVMRGASEYLMGRYDLALADLTHPTVTGNDEARLWAAAATAQQGDRLGSARDLRFTGSIARDYPRPLKMPLGILITEVSAETGDGQGAQLFLEALNLEDPRAHEIAQLKFAEGKVRELDGDFEAAVALWEDVTESDDRPSRARARVALTEMLLKLRRIGIRDAIEEYEKLRFAWRGDKMEFNNLRRLGSLYLDEGFFREGLSTLKEAATHFRELPEAPEITKQMSDTFNSLFLGDEAAELDPVKAIAIYNEFKELTPAGARGDAMIRNLADRLVDVDLLDRAAELLSAQVQFRLDGVQKARVGGRLALIYTLDRNYERALQVLNATGVDGMPEDLANQRRHLLAQVLIGLNRENDALALLENDESESAELLRAEIFWNSGNWLEAASSYRLLVKQSGATPEELLTDSQAARILNYAVALTNAGGERAIQQLKLEYEPAMSQSKFAEAFQLVTAQTTPGILDPLVVPSKVQEVETFLAAYKSKLKDGMPLSSIN